MKVVFAKSTFTYGPSLVKAGQHWPADDPVVLGNPDSFSENPRYGLSYSVEPSMNDQVLEERTKRSYVRRT